MNYTGCLIPILGIFIPIPGVLLALLVPDWGYVVNEFPPFLCFSQNLYLSYYLVNFPLNILSAVGVFLHVLMFWKLHKVRIIILTHFRISCLHSIKVYFIPGKIADLSSVQLRKRFFLCCVIMLYLLWLCWCILDLIQQILIYLNML